VSERTLKNRPTENALHEGKRKTEKGIRTEVRWDLGKKETGEKPIHSWKEAFIRNLNLSHEEKKDR